MPRLVHKTPKYRRHATGQAVVTLNGRDVYLGPHGTAQSKREYDRLVGEWLAGGRSAPSGGGDYAVVELIAAYLAHCKTYFAVAAGKSDGEMKSIKLALRVLKRLYADAEVGDFGPLSLRSVQEAMVAEGEDGWSRTYVNAQVNRLRRVFKWGVSREIVPAEVWHALQAVPPLKAGKTRARENQPVTTVADEFIDAALPWLSRQVRAMVELQRATGMRPGEVVVMRGVDLDTRNPKLWEYRPAEHKTKTLGHERIVYLNAEAQAILGPHLKPDLSAYLFSPADAEAERREAAGKARKTPLSCGNRPGTNRQRKPRRTPGERYDVNSYRRAITRACDLADRWAKGGMVIDSAGRAVPRWHPHQIRHNTATKLRAKHGLEAAQVILGHKTLSATQIYAEKNVEKAKRIMIEGA